MRNLLFLLLLPLGFISINGCQAQQGQLLDAKGFEQKIKTSPHAQLIDVRTAEEFKGGFIPGARNIDFNDPDFKKKMLALQKDTPVLVYCLSGGRSHAAATYLREQGFTQVYELQKGTMAWTEAGFQLQREEGSVPIAGISYEDYMKMVQDSVPVLVDLYAPWCVPCKKMEPDLEALQKEFPGKFRLIRINVDENKNLTSQLRVDAIPVLFVYKNGKQTLRMEGLTGKNAMQEALFGPQ